MSDIDLMVVADDLSHTEVFGALQEAEKVIGRPVNPNMLTAEEWITREAVVAEGPIPKNTQQESA